MSVAPPAKWMGTHTGLLEVVDKSGCCILRDTEGHARPFLPKEIRGYDGRDPDTLWKLGFIRGAIVRFDPTGKGAENVVVVNPRPTEEAKKAYLPKPVKLIIRHDGALP